ncbi:MAG: hypothetical protein FWD92_04775 [Methanomassiliicoccaceae archaeon]|nr:hypothetical protein [Methanomassiliicoccaceae archaeon]
MKQRDERSSTYPRRFPTPLIAGIILMFTGIFVMALGVYSIIASAVSGSTLGLIAGLLILPVGIIAAIIGSAFVFSGTLGWIVKRGGRRILY